MSIVRISLLFFYLAFGGATVQAYVLSGENVDLGSFNENETKATKLTIRNNESSGLEVVSVRPTCSCTGYQIKGPEKISPGEAREIEFSITFGDLIGRFETAIEITLRREGKIEKIFARVKGQVKALAHFSTKQIDFGQVNILKLGGEHRDITLEKTPSSNWDKIELQVDNPAIKATLSETGGSRVLRVSVGTSDLDLGQFRSQVILRFTDSDGKEVGNVNIPVVVFVEGEMRAVPKYVYLGVVKPSKTSVSHIRVVSEHLDLSSTYVESLPDWLSVEIKETNKSSAEIELHCNSPQKTGPMNGTVKIRVKGYDHALVVNVVGVVEKEI